MVVVDRILLILVLILQVTLLVFLRAGGSSHGDSQRDAGALRESALPDAVVSDKEANDPHHMRAELESMVQVAFSDGVPGGRGRIENGDMILSGFRGRGPSDAHVRMMEMVKSMFAEFDQMAAIAGFGRSGDPLVLSPAVDMREAGSNYIVVLSLPYVEQSSVSAVLHGRLLIVSGELVGNMHGARRFDKRMQLPGPVTVGGSSATLTNGILRVIAPKAVAMLDSDKSERILY
jgi:HSP20 family molecular chaperone IbpA